MGSRSIDQWRHYFGTARGDIFDVIKNAIAVAALDFPEEFRLKRAQIVENLFLCQLTNPENNNNAIAESKEQVISPVNSSVNDNGDVNLNYSKDCNYHETEALTMKIEEEKQRVEKVLKIKEVLDKFERQSEDVVIEALQRLQMMSLTVETLQATKIGKAVTLLRCHKSKRISNFAGLLVRDWKDIVEQWCRADPDIKGGESSPDSVHLPGVQGGHPSPLLDEGAILARVRDFVAQYSSGESSSDSVHLPGVQGDLPSPPLDKGALLARGGAFLAQTSAIEFSKGMDDDGNSKSDGGFNSKRLNERKPAQQDQRIPMRALSPHEANIACMENRGEETRRNKRSKGSSTDVGLVKAPISRFKVGDETMLEKKLNAGVARPMSLPGQQNRVRFLNGEDQMKLEAARNKLHNGYQQAENAKKQRKIQVMELQELPTQGFGTGHPRPKSRNQNRKFSRGPR